MKESLFVRMARLLPDKTYLSLKFYKEFGRYPDWKNPRTFSEKLQWLKLYDRRPEYTIMVDKYAVKDYVAKKIGAEYVIPTLGVWDRPEEIEWEKLPNQFVLKTTHGGGNEGVVICRDKNVFDKENAIRRLNESFHTDLYKVWREWPYKNVPKRVIAEKFIEPQPDTNDLADYKFFCFNKKCEYFKIDFDRQKNHHANYYNKDCVLMYFGEILCPPEYSRNLVIPGNINEMIEKAELIASDINSSFVRIDLYNVDGRIYFGEITFYPAAGLGKFEPEEWDKRLGDMLKLPKIP